MSKSDYRLVHEALRELQGTLKLLVEQRMVTAHGSEWRAWAISILARPQRSVSADFDRDVANLLRIILLDFRNFGDVLGPGDTTLVRRLLDLRNQAVSSRYDVDALYECLLLFYAKIGFVSPWLESAVEERKRRELPEA
jgi:hypothetical protein